MIARRCVLLAGIVAATYPLVAYLATRQFGDSAWTSAAVAAAVCWLGAALALALTACLRGPQGAMYGMLFGMLFRMGLPLVVGMVLINRESSLAAHGLMPCLLAFYFVTLIAETILVLPLVQAGARAKA